MKKLLFFFFRFYSGRTNTRCDTVGEHTHRRAPPWRGRRAVGGWAAVRERPAGPGLPWACRRGWRGTGRPRPRSVRRGRTLAEPRWPGLSAGRGPRHRPRHRPRPGAPGGSRCKHHAHHISGRPGQFGVVVTFSSSTYRKMMPVTRKHKQNFFKNFRTTF
jgi:hypothetical protein